MHLVQDPGTDKKSIRKAYYDAMRDCHPDTSSAEESTEFATFLNEIYEVRISASGTRLQVTCMSAYLATSASGKSIFARRFFALL